MGIETDLLNHRMILPTDSWYGAKRFAYRYNLQTFRFPKSWDITVFEPDRKDDLRAMDEEQIRQSVRNPIGSEPLRKIAEQRKNAVIIVDDLSRPTPAFAVMPYILEELTSGGIREENIRIIIGLGTHRPLHKFEQRRKLGSDIVDRFEVVNHNAFTTQLTKYKRPDDRPDIEINRVVGEADLKIAIGGIIPHSGAGFGGGAKSILPAVSSYRTIMFNHETYEWEGYGIVYPKKITSPGIRKDMEEVARIVGLDFVVNLVFTPCKEPIGVFSGDFVKAHRKGCVLARDVYLTDTPEEKLDIIIANGYPLDTDLGQSHRGVWPESFGYTGVLMGGSRDGWAFHGDNGKSYRVHMKNRKNGEASGAYRFKGTKDVTGENHFYYSKTLDPARFYERDINRTLFNHWDALMDALYAKHKRATVGVFPYAALQLEKK